MRGNVADLAVRVSALMATRTVAGVVSSAGAVLAGTDYTPARNATGDYTITFTAAFSGTPAMTVTGAGAGIVARIYAESATAVSFFTFVSSTGASADSK